MKRRLFCSFTRKGFSANKFLLFALLLLALGVPRVYAAPGLVLTWVDNSANEDGFRVYREEGGVSGFAVVMEPGQNIQTWIDTGVTPGISYCFYLTAYNTVGESASSDTDCATARNGVVTLTISKSGTGVGTISSSPAGVDCGSMCSFAFNEGTVVSLSALAGGGSEFVSWSGGCSGSGACTLTLVADITVGAQFMQLSLALSVQKSGTGGGMVTSAPAGIDCGSVCVANYPFGTAMSLTAVANTDSVFAGWNSACLGNGSCDLTMDSAKFVGAQFDYVPPVVTTFTLSVVQVGVVSGLVQSMPVGINCGANCDYAFADGASVILTALPNVGAVFTGWSGPCNGSSGDCVVAVSTNLTVMAYFAPVGPVLDLRFNEGAGFVATDSSGFGNHGTIQNAVWTSGKSSSYGKALSFNGSNAKVVVPHSPSLDLKKGMTILAWASTAANGRKWRTIALKGQDGQAALVYSLYANGPYGSTGNRPWGFVYANGIEQGVNGTNVLQSSWRRVAVTYDGTSLRFYDAGKLVKTVAVSGLITSSTMPLEIGGNSVWADEYFKGKLDNVRIFQRALSLAEIQADINTP